MLKTASDNFLGNSCLLSIKMKSHYLNIAQKPSNCYTKHVEWFNKVVQLLIKIIFTNY